MMRDDFIQAGSLFFFFGEREHTNIGSRTLFSEEVMRFDAITPRTSERRIAPFTDYMCVFVFVFVCQ